MVRRDQIGDFKRRPILRSRVAPMDISSGTKIRSVENIDNTKVTPVASTKFIDIRKSKSRPKPKPVQPRQNKSKVLRRQGLKKLPTFTPRKTKKHIFRGAVIASSFVLLFGVSLSIYFGKRSSNKSSEEKNVMAAVDTKPVDPSEVEPTQSEVSSYEVASDMPRYFKSKRLGIDARIKKSEFKDNKLIVPDNIYDVGWHKNGEKPGLGGTTLISGSVSGQTKNGVFGRIGSINVGDVIVIEMGDGTVHSYIVKHTKSYPKDQVNNEELLKSIEPGKEALNLIALANRFDVRSQDFEDNFAVFAVKE